jgi:hypothetical protein
VKNNENPTTKIRLSVEHFPDKNPNIEAQFQEKHKIARKPEKNRNFKAQILEPRSPRLTITL